MKSMKAERHVFQGDDAGDGAVECRGGDSSGSIIFLAGPIPAQKDCVAVREGWAIKCVDKEISNPAVAGSLVVTVPKGAQILAAQMIIKTAGAAAGTTTTLSMGTDADPDKYCTIGAPTQADSLAKNAKGKQCVDLDSSVLAADEDVQAFPAATGGTVAGDTLSGAVVRCVVIWAELQDLKNYD